MLIPASSYASIVAFSQTDEYGIPIGATGLVLEGDNAVDANQDYVNFDSYLDESCEANGTCFKGGVGIRLQVIKYEGGSEIAIGNPLYIINDALLDDIVLTNGVAIPGSYDSFASRNWGFTQHIAPEINFTDNWIVDDNPSGGEEGNPNLRQATYEMEGPDHTPLEGQTLEFPGQFSYQYDMSHCKGLPSGKGLASKSDAPIGHKTDYVHYIYR